MSQARLDPLLIGLINPLAFEDRKLLNFEEIPEVFLKLLVVAEDRRFFQHFGLDPIGIARAAFRNLAAGATTQGGSTLTQQLVKNMYLSRDRTVSRKIKESLMALSIERRFSKAEIIEAYVNEVFLGQDGGRAIHGFGLGAEFYFGRPLGELDIAQMALLIGLVKGPTRYDPRRYPERAIKRRNLLVDIASADGLVSVEQASALKRSALQISARKSRAASRYSSFLDRVRSDLGRNYNEPHLKGGGLRVFSTLDPYAQHLFDRVLSSEVEALEKRQRIEAGKLQVAGVVIDRRTAEVIALQGSASSKSSFNRALDSHRPIGSLVKPFLFARALEKPKEFNLASTLQDRMVVWRTADGKDWAPKNFDGREYGSVSALDALLRSLNLATVDLGMRISVADFAPYLSRITGKTIGEFPAIFLGAIELSPLEVARAYLALANGGVLVEPRVIDAVVASSGSLESQIKRGSQRVMESGAAAMVEFALTEVTRVGTGRAIGRRHKDTLPLAGKTGTSDDERDSWFAGYGQNYLAAIWVGRDDNAPINLTGSTGALKIWSAFMLRLGVSALNLEMPEQIDWLRVDGTRGQQVPAHCTRYPQLPVHRASILPLRSSCLDKH
ncbi:MAG: transglycosylase domain-containing protein [Pseudomonadota bacterium]